MYTYKWGEYVAELGEDLIATYLTDLDAFSRFCERLKGVGCMLIGMNEEGVIIEYIDLFIEGALNLKIAPIEVEQNTIKSNVQYYNEEYQDKFNTIAKDISVLIEGKKEEESVPGFYLMWNLLPEHLQKELSIYIKKL